MSIDQIIKNKYSNNDARILQHGRFYLITAQKLYEDMEDNGEYIYPILNLLAISAELFFKGLNAKLTESYIDSNGISLKIVKYNINEPINKSTTTSTNKLEKYFIKADVESSSTNIHHLDSLYNQLIEKDSELNSYLSTKYKSCKQRDLLKDLKTYRNIFQESRYAYESEYKEKKTIADISIVYYLVNFLYDSINLLYID